MWTHGWRDGVWGELDRPWDVVIVGGGITGAGVLAEAARAGLRALLVEARDFASGTSSRSTKLVHGGLRYLRQAQLRVTRESVIERERLLREAQGLVRPLGFYLASFRGDRTPGWMFRAGLAIYDLIAGKWAHERYTTREVFAREPSLAGAPLEGAYYYFDAQTDDARLVLRVLREAVRRGGTALNYARVEGLLRAGDGRVCGVTLIDEAPEGGGRTIEVRARAVVNATGAWADDLRVRLGAKKKLRSIRGSHLVFPTERLPLSQAITLLHPRDGRAVFAVPWEGVTLFGTTDVDHHEDLAREPWMAASEADYLLEAVRHVFPTRDLRLEDVRSTYAGVRSVINTGAQNPAKESREHALWNEDGLLTVTGGKLTTFRVMALEVLRALSPVFPDRGLDRVTRGRILEDPAHTAGLVKDLDPAVEGRLLGRYGSEIAQVLACGADATESIGGSCATWGELRWGAQAEGVVHLDDLLLRRVRLGLLLDEGGARHLARIRAVVQPLLGWDDIRWVREEERYRTTWARCYGTSFEREVIAKAAS